MRLMDIDCSWCQTILEDGLMLDIGKMGWKTYQSNAHLCRACHEDANSGPLLEDPRLIQYRYSSYYGRPGEVIFIGNDDATRFIEGKIVSTIPLKSLPAVFDDIECGKLYRTTSHQHDEVRDYFTTHHVAILAEQGLAAIRQIGDQKIKTELNAKNLPAGRAANIAAVKSMLGMRSKK